MVVARFLWRLLRPAGHAESLQGWLDFTPVGGGALVALVTAILGLPILLALVAILAILAAWVVISAFGLFLETERQKEKPRPVFRFTREWVDRREIEPPTAGAFFVETMSANYAPQFKITSPSATGTDSADIEIPTEDGRPYFAHAEMCNDPPLRWRTPEADATSVFPTLRFFKADNESPLFEIDGRWGCCATQPAAQSPLHSVEPMRRVDFPANGESHYVDIAIKHPDDAGCYAFSSTSFFASRGCRPEWRLSGGEFRVEVALNGHRTQEVAKYRLLNLGKGQGLQIERLDPDTREPAPQ